MPVINFSFLPQAIELDPTQKYQLPLFKSSAIRTSPKLLFLSCPIQNFCKVAELSLGKRKKQPNIAFLDLQKSCSVAFQASLQRGSPAPFKYLSVLSRPLSLKYINESLYKGTHQFSRWGRTQTCLTSEPVFLTIMEYWLECEHSLRAFSGHRNLKLRGRGYSISSGRHRI